MVRLPAPLERRLAEIYPRIREREEFVAQLLEDALNQIPIQDSAFEHDMTADETSGGMVGGTVHLFTDGGSRGNPGESAIAYIIENPQQGVTLKQHGERIGVETNNVAEYRALIEGLKAAQHFHPNRLICHLDSELIVKQMNGQYQVKMPTLQPLHDEVRKLSMLFADIVFKHIPRSDNYRADALVNKALDAAPPPSWKPLNASQPRPIPPMYPEDRLSNLR